MPPLSELPSDLSRDKFITALRKSGFIINSVGGKGSHIKAIWPKNNKEITIQKETRKDVLKYILKNIETISGITWDDIKKFL